MPKGPKSRFPEIDMSMVKYCGCGCGAKLVIRSYHRWKGIPDYIQGHRQKAVDTTDYSQIKYCKCGCGEQINVRAVHRYNGIPNYISGHNMLSKQVIPWNANTAKFKDLVDIPKYCKCGCGERIKILRGHRSTGIPDYINHHYFTTDEFYNKRVARGLPPQCMYDTSIELKLQHGLDAANIPFQSQKRMYGFPDIFIKPNICIFADGDYWHAHPLRYKEDDIVHHDKKACDIWAKDKKVTDVLTNKGYTVIRFWECDINSNIELCIDTIKNFI